MTDRYVDFNFQLTTRALAQLGDLLQLALDDDNTPDEQTRREFETLACTCYAQLTHVVADAKAATVPGRSGNEDWLDE